MKKFLTTALLVGALALSACAHPKTIDGVTYRPYGFFNRTERHNANIQYKVVPGNAIWSILLCETLVFPVYFLGFSIMEPVGKATDAPH